MLRFLNRDKIDSSLLRECSDYLSEACRITAFHSRETELYDRALFQYGKQVGNDPKAAMEIQKAMDRLSQAAREALRRHEEIDQIPILASPMHHAWWYMLRAFSTWTSTRNKAITAERNGVVVEQTSIEKLMNEYRKAWIKAENEEKRLFKYLKLSNGDITKIAQQAENAVSAENWNPVSRLDYPISTDTSSPSIKTNYEETEIAPDLSVSAVAELTPGIRRKYGIDDVKWFTEFMRLYNQSKITNITKLDSDGMPVDYVAILEGTTTLPPILKAVQNLPRPKDKGLRLLRKEFEEALRAAIIASEDAGELAECQDIRIPAASIAFGLRYAAEITERLTERLGKAIG